MSLRNSVVRASGGFEFSGAYSIELISKKNKSKGIMDTMRNLSSDSYGEHFFYPGLTRLEHQYTYNIASKVTFGGSSTVDYGNGFSYITISAEIHPFYQGKPVRNPDLDTSSMASMATSAAGKVLFEALDIFNPIKKPGYIEMIDLIWLFSKSRDGIDGFKDYPSSIGGQTANTGATYPNAGDLQSNAESDIDYLNADNVTLVFHDYDRDEHWIVALDPQNGFNISSSIEKPQLYIVTIKLVGLKQLPRKRKITRPMVPSVRSLLNNALFDLSGIMQQLSSDLRVFTDIFSDWKDLNKYTELLKNDVRTFRETNKKSIASTKKRSKQTGEKNRALLYLILSKYDSEKKVPDGNITTVIPDPIYSDNPVSQGTVNLTEVATNQTVKELNQLTTILSTIDLAMVLAENNLNTNNLSGLYTIQPGDTLASIANQTTGDPSEIQSIIDLNPNSSFTAGETIQVPGDVNIIGLNNPEILTSIPDLNSIENLPNFLENSLLGADITPTLEANINNDIGVVSGIDSLLDTIDDILNNVPGTVPLHPDFTPLEIIGQPSEQMLNLSIPRQILEAIESEPGVKSAQIISLDFEGGRLKSKISIVPITSNQPIIIEFDRISRVVF